MTQDLTMFSFIITLPAAYIYSTMMREENKRTSAGRRNSRKFAALNSPKPFSLDTKSSRIRSVHFQPPFKNGSQPGRQSVEQRKVDRNQNRLNISVTQDPVKSGEANSKVEPYKWNNMRESRTSSLQDESAALAPDQHSLAKLAEFLTSINIGSKGSSTTTIAEDERPYTDDDLQDEIESVLQSNELNSRNTVTSLNTAMKNMESEVAMAKSALSHDSKANSVSQIDVNSFTCLVEKPGEDDFVLPPLPPPPSEEDLVSFTNQSSNSSKTDSPPQTSVMSPTYRASTKYNIWTPGSNGKNANDTVSDGPKKFSSAVGPTGFRSVARPVSKGLSDSQTVFCSLLHLNSNCNNNKGHIEMDMQHDIQEGNKSNIYHRTTANIVLKRRTPGEFRFQHQRMQSPATVNKSPQDYSTIHRFQQQNGMSSASQKNQLVTLLRDTRRILIKPEKGPAMSTVTTNYTFPSKGLPPASENVRITPNNELPEGAVYETQTLEGNVLHTDTYYPTTGEKAVLERTKKTTIIKAEHHDGMGPTDDQGVPVALRSTVNNPKQWYKNMFKQIHKFDREDEENESGRATAYDIQEERPVISQTPAYKPKKLGRITDYMPSSPYVVENKPHHESIPQASTSYKPARTEHNKKPETSPGQEPVHGTEYHEKDYTMADYVVTEPKHVVQIHPAKPKGTKSPGIRKTARAKFEFVAQNDKQLALKKEQVVVITREVNKDWYEGESMDGKCSGMFPVAYVQIIAGHSEKKQVKKGLAKAKFDFNGTNPKLLSVKKGDSLELLEKVDENWYKAFGQRSGLIPANYLEVIQEPEKPKTVASQQNSTPVSKPTSSVDKAPNFNQYFHAVSVSSSSSNSEPDDKEKMSKASFLAHAVVNSGAKLSKPKATKGEYDIPELDDAAMGISPRETDRDPVHRDSVDTTTSAISSDLAQNLNIAQPTYSMSSDNTKDFEDEFPITREKYVCTFGYNPQNEDELELIPGDVIQVVEKCDDGWYVGTCERTGGFGTFPGNYVEPAH